MFMTLVIVAVAAFVMYQITNMLVVTVTPSVEHRVFYKSDESARKGDYVTFMLNHEFTDNNDVRVTKVIKCMGGDILTTSESRHYCNGQALGLVKKETIDGKPMKSFVYDGVIPVGKAFVYGGNKDSFDSRYWGFIDLSTAQRLLPLI